ncbi:class F sortase [Streptomyces sp. NPDC001848]|uniref:class F sortase n=1 Tax=Streptomyces sp. NPDC001848 TaxID=3364618 RepID=UPI0036950847
MALSQPAPPDRPRGGSKPRRTAGRALLWPAVAVGLGALLIHNSLTGTPADPKPAAPTTVAVPPANLDPPVDAAPPATATPVAPGPDATASPRQRGLPRSAPKRIAIPQIGVDAPFTELSLGASGHLTPPPGNNTNLVGWYRGGASPGERGTSIVVGHVDTKTGPAVFVLLRTLKPGSKVDITRDDGIVARFKVDSVETFSKAGFPDDRVYADAPTPQLRLITCGGVYNRSVHDYESNVVVFAHLVSAKRPSA